MLCRIETYLEYLAAFGEAHPSPASLEFDWSWPLGGKPDSFMRVPGLASEHAEVGTLQHDERGNY